MNVRVIGADLKNVVADLLVVGLFEGVKKPSGAARRADSLVQGEITEAIRKGELTGKFGESILFSPGKGAKARRIMVLGLGKRENLTPDRLRHLSLYPVKMGRRLKVKTIATVVHGTGMGGLSMGEAVKFLSLGYLLSDYRYDRFKELKEHGIDTLKIVDRDRKREKEIRKGLFFAQGVASGINFSRDLVNTPPMYLKPSDLSKEALKLSGDKVTVKVFNEKDIARMGLGGLYAVGMGSSSPPRLVVARYQGGKRGEKPVALVGKGITFDTGGISLKKWEGMDKMKYDMAGAAAALGTIRAISRLGAKTNVVAVVPVAENMPSGSAYRPGDIIKTMSGKTVEVLSTDAEGRIVLADAIWYARKKLKPRSIVDIATLTGACVVALGDLAMGLMGNDRKMIDLFLDASRKSGERAWELPLYEEYGEQIKSQVADIKNIGGHEGGAITAGYFLKHFVGDTPWVHLDIAGVAWMEKEKTGYLPGPTGAGVRLITEALAAS